MINRTCFPARIFLGSIASIALLATVVASVCHADEQINAIQRDVIDLKIKVATLQNDFESDHAAALLTKTQLDQARKDIATLKQRAVDQDVRINALQVAVEELLKRQGEDPGKPPAPRKPADNQPLTLRA